MELRKYINETLLEERERKLHSSYDELNDIRDKEYFLERYFAITSNLLNEGYSIEEVESILNEIENPLSDVDVSGNILSAGGSQLKEYAINLLLTFVFGGKNQGMISTISVVFADYDIRDILKPFKDEPNCMTHMPKMIDGILEALSRYVAGNSNVIVITGTGANINGYANVTGNINDINLMYSMAEYESLELPNPPQVISWYYNHYREKPDLNSIIPISKLFERCERNFRSKLTHLDHCIGWYRICCYFEDWEARYIINRKYLTKNIIRY